MRDEIQIVYAADTVPYPTQTDARACFVAAAQAFGYETQRNDAKLAFLVAATAFGLTAQATARPCAAGGTASKAATEDRKAQDAALGVQSTPVQAQRSHPLDPHTSAQRCAEMRARFHSVIAAEAEAIAACPQHIGPDNAANTRWLEARTHRITGSVVGMVRQRCEPTVAGSKEASH